MYFLQDYSSFKFVKNVIIKLSLLKHMYIKVIRLLKSSSVLSSNKKGKYFSKKKSVNFQDLKLSIKLSTKLF